MEKTLEVKIRILPGQERQDQKDLSRVFLSRDAMLDLRIDSGHMISIWREDDTDSKMEAVAWLTVQKLNKTVVQMFKTFQSHCGFRLEDRILLSPAGDVPPAESIILRDMTEGIAISAIDRPHWEWYMEDKLSRAEYVYTGMTFDVSLRGPRRSFAVAEVHSTVLPARRLGRYVESSKIHIGHDGEVIAGITANTFASDMKSLEITNLTGIDQALSRLNDFLEPFYGPPLEAFRKGQSAGLLIHGISGAGKSHILEKLLETGWGEVFRIETDAKALEVREMLKQAAATQPSMIFVDNIDTLFKESAAAKTIERELGEYLDRIPPHCFVVATACSLLDVPLSLRQVHRLETEILLPIPDAHDRRAILRSMADSLFAKEVAPSTDALNGLAERTHAYTQRDLLLLLHESSRCARRRVLSGHGPSESQSHAVLSNDLESALHAVKPSAMNDITLRPPNVRWEDIGGQDSVKKALRFAVDTSHQHAELFKIHNHTPKKGILLYGPPGCSKTLSAQAMATEASQNFLAVKGAELLNMYVGESERAVREVFARARAAAPAIIFFDEIDSIAASRDSRGHNGVNIVTTLLNEMDGIEALGDVTILAATNKPEILDVALLRPGRFDDVLYVAPPDQKGRQEILQTQRNRGRWAPEIDIVKLAFDLTGYSGAEIVSVCRSATERVIRRSMEANDNSLSVGLEDFQDAIKHVKPQITLAMVNHYERWAESRVTDGG